MTTPTKPPPDPSVRFLRSLSILLQEYADQVEASGGNLAPAAVERGFDTHHSERPGTPSAPGRGASRDVHDWRHAELGDCGRNKL